ncbi:MAG: cystathionine gamma-synthase [Pelagibacteraceae bacterium]|jgi:cystathionine beta-lyase/cystathionine gamma-synthase|nr:cystathionine gamma-synthase [Pelagibacteraceae bacterium]
MKNKKFNTKVIHSGHGADEASGSVMPPINLSSTFKQKEPGSFTYEYARTKNPTRDILENLMANIEGGDKAFAFASGMAAINTLCEIFESHIHIICSDDVYGGTRRLFDKVKSKSQNLEVSYVDFDKNVNWDELVKDNTKFIWLETPSNPLLKIIDIKNVVEIAKEFKIPVICDNTFASAYNQRPLELGADIVINSSTKYLGGHSDLIGGSIVINKNDQLADQLAYLQNAAGAVPSPFDCYLLIRSIKTLSVRMEKHNSNANLIANYLENHPKILKVYYPGLENYKNYEIAKKQMHGFGGMISIVLDCDIDGVKKFLKNLSVFTLAESLGGVESLIEHPAIMTHASIDKEIRDKLGISDSLVRLSIGIEDVQDIKNDLEESLNLI